MNVVLLYYIDDFQHAFVQPWMLVPTQPAFTCLKSFMKTSEQYKKSVQS